MYRNVHTYCYCNWFRLNIGVRISVVKKATRGYSSVVEHSTADREVPGSNPGVPSLFVVLENYTFVNTI